MPAVLITGTGKAGSSWTIRGEQLGEAIGATIAPMATAEQCRAADLIVVVKRTSDNILGPVLDSGRPWVWDVVDAWPQAPGKSISEADSRAWLRGTLHRLRPTGIVWPTERMQADANWDGPQITLPHHALPRYTPQPLRERVAVLGYEGAAHYLGRWRGVLDGACEARGWRLMVNGDMHEADIGVALRDAGGYAASAWKSNVKLANIQALGIPAICSPECGYMETATGGERWIRDEADLACALDGLSSRQAREAARDAHRAHRVDLGRIAAQYRAWLSMLSC